MKNPRSQNYSVIVLIIIEFFFPFYIAGQTVSSFTLINANTKKDIGLLVNGQVLNLATLPTRNLNVRANIVPEKAGRVKFSYDNNADFNTERGVPYLFAGDLNGIYNSWTPETGIHTIGAIPYDRSNGNGVSGKALTVTFRVIDRAENTPRKNIVISGELKKWHKVTLTLDGPSASETGIPNPFLDYRFEVTFTHTSGKSYKVPGYFAADGNAAETGANSGNKWRAHFAPDETGEWSYIISFREGHNIAVSDNANAGKAVSPLEGEKGSFIISATDKTGKDLRGKGRLEYVGAPYLQFAETGEYFRKAGADAPENLLAYEDFDNTSNIGGRRKNWAPHIQDWNAGDPTWKGGKGKGIIGAVNYLSEQGMNVFSFLTMSIEGDDKNVSPYLDTADFTRIDVSKVDQWEILMDHAQKIGLYIHVKMQERENDRLLNGGDLGIERKLYCRELIARFSHHLAMNWNVGEENTQTDRQRKDMSKYIYENDPYKHNLVIHTYPGEQENIYRPLLGKASSFTGISVQTNSTNVYKETKKWVLASASAGKKWIVANDEQGPFKIGVTVDAEYKGRKGIAPDNSELIRKNVLWGNFMAGGAGVEYYFGTATGETDISCQDFRSRAKSWKYAKYALEFFDTYLSSAILTPMNNVSSGWSVGKDNEVYVVYLKHGGTSRISIGSGNYTVKWYNPRKGGGLQNGSVTFLRSGNKISIGKPPSDPKSDWVALIINDNTKVNSSYQAEDYTAQSGITTATIHQGFTGSGYVDYAGRGTWMEWNNVIGNSEKITLTFYYTNGSSQNREAEIMVNGMSAGVLDFSPTAGWTDWQKATLTVYLPGGSNTIRVSANTGSGGPNLDKLEVSGKNENKNSSTVNSAMKRPSLLKEEIAYDNEVAVYPNPTSGLVNVKSNHTFSEINIYNSNGTRVYHANAGKMHYQIDLSAFGSGIYYIKTDIGDKIITSKVAVIK